MKTVFPRRRGFTLIELLIVIAIIGVLIALLVPAVQRVRSSASRTECLNNLKQMGLAMHGHHDSFRRLAYSRQSGSVPNRSWAPDLLPFLEQANLVSSANYFLDRNWWIGDPGDPGTVAADIGVPNYKTVRMSLKIFLCPSTPFQQRTQKKIETTGSNKIGACGDYFTPEGINGTNINAKLAAGDTPFPTSGPNLFGVLRPYPDATRLLQVSDGTSNTILLAECAGREDVWRGRTMTQADANQSSATCARAQGGAWATNDNPYELGSKLTAWCTSTGLTGAIPGTWQINTSNEYGFLYYSFHDGGANFCFADGSVRFLSESISLAKLAALTTRAGSEAIGSSD